ncbi:MAG: caspase family protein [Sphaerochaeta sp.]|jgi:hypothetical protein|nr:caspase family protein [Sphaerochaeta sp.]
MNLPEGTPLRRILSSLSRCIIGMLLCAVLVSCEFIQSPQTQRVNLLSIGLSYSGTNANTLGGTINDATEVYEAFAQLYGTAIVSSALLTDDKATKAAVLQQLSSLPQADLTIVYYSGHGVEDGSLVLYANPILREDETINPESLLGVDELLAALEAIPGTKLFINDSCYSGAFVQGNGSTVSLVGEDDPFGEVFRAFFTRHSYQNDLFVLSCTTADNTGKESRLWSHKHGYFTQALLDAMGWNHQGNLDPPDTLTLDGLYRTIKQTQQISLSGTYGQHPMVFQGTENLVLYQANGN